MSATANIDINVDTSGAEQNLDSLNQSIQESAGSFKAFKDAGDLLGGTVSTLVGGLSLLGVENKYIKNFEQASLGAIAFAGGVDRVGKGLIGLSKNTQVATVATRVFNTVLKANPVVLIATAIIGLGTAIFALTRATRENTQAEEENRRARELNVEILERLRDAEDRLARVRAASREEELALDLSVFDKQIEKLQKVISLTSENDVNFQNLISQLNVLEVEREIVLEKISKERENRLTKEKQQRDKEIEDERQARIRANAEQAQDAADLLAAIEALQNEFEDSRLSQEERELNAVREKYFGIIEAAREAGLEVATLEENLEIELAEIRARFNEVVIEEQENEIDNFQTVYDAKLAIAAQTFNALGQLNNAFANANEQSQKKAFQVQKGLSIAEATISTYQAANAVLASAAANPASILFPGYPALQAGLIIASGLANVRNISKQKFTSTSTGGISGGGGFGGGVASGVPSISGPPEGFERQAELFAQQQAIQAYVVTGDIQNGLEAQNQIQARRTL